jgi:hypothetical protein
MSTTPNFIKIHAKNCHLGGGRHKNLNLEGIGINLNFLNGVYKKC